MTCTKLKEDQGPAWEGAGVGEELCEFIWSWRLEALKVKLNDKN